MASSQWPKSWFVPSYLQYSAQYKLCRNTQSSQLQTKPNTQLNLNTEWKFLFLFFCKQLTSHGAPFSESGPSATEWTTHQRESLWHHRLGSIPHRWPWGPSIGAFPRRPSNPFAASLGLIPWQRCHTHNHRTPSLLLPHHGLMRCDTSSAKTSRNRFEIRSSQKPSSTNFGDGAVTLIWGARRQKPLLLSSCGLSTKCRRVRADVFTFLFYLFYYYYYYLSNWYFDILFFLLCLCIVGVWDIYICLFRIWVKCMFGKEATDETVKEKTTWKFNGSVSLLLYILLHACICVSCVIIFAENLTLWFFPCVGLFSIIKSIITNHKNCLLLLLF